MRFLILAIAEMDEFQQLKWLDKYHSKGGESKLTEKLILEINDKENEYFGSIRELITQPILLGMIARANFEIIPEYNRAKIYDELFSTLIQRNWDKKGQLEKFETLQDHEDDFRRYLTALAFRIYQSDNEFISRTDLLEMDETKEFVEENFKSGSNNLEEALKDILITFYFKEANNRGEKLSKKEYAIEFYHKSLQEFLVAEKIWKTILEEFTEKDRRNRYKLKDWREALKIIWELTTPKPVSREVADYLAEIIQNEKDEKIKIELANRIYTFFPDLIYCQFLYQYNVYDSRSSYQPINQQSSCFFTYWHIFSHLESGENLIQDESFQKFIDLLKITHFENFQILNLRNQILKGADLRGVDLSIADLSKANLCKANLNRVDLSSANVKEADLGGVNLNSAVLYGADLRRTNLYGANLDGADLREAKLCDANLDGADLRGANLYGANLDGADLRRANLYGIDLRRASLHDADLRGADLRGADLSGADLSKANLSGADLRGTNLEEGKLHGVDLSSTNLGAYGLTVEQLLEVKTLWGTKGIGSTAQKIIRERKPELFQVLGKNISK